MKTRIALTVGAGLLALSGCGAQPPLGHPDDALTVRTTVLDDGSGAQACDVLMESFPPQCSGIPIDGWDWHGVTGYQQSGQVRWGSYELTVRDTDQGYELLEDSVALEPDVSPLPADSGEILQPGHGAGPETGR